MAQTITLNYTRPALYKKQSEAFFNEKRFCFIESSTKAGKTLGCMIWLYEQALQPVRKELNNYWWVAPTFKQAEIAYTRYMHMIPRSFIFKSNINEFIQLQNGSIIHFKTGEKPDNLYGDDVRACVQDEASRQREETFYAIRSVLTATNGLYRGIGNVKGRSNWFYKMCRKAEQGMPDSHYAMMTAYDAAKAGIISYAEIESAKQTLPDIVFQELYMCQPSDLANNPFGYNNIDICTTKDTATSFALSEQPAVCWGWDIAKTVDWTVGIALDKDGRVCGFERWQLPYLGTKAQIFEIVGRTPYLIDATGAGIPFVEELQQKHGNQCEGFTFTASSKQQLMEGLAAAIKQHLIKFPEGAIVTELEQFEWKHTNTGVRYSAPEGLHDDCVCALALAWRKWQSIQHSNNIIMEVL